MPSINLKCLLAAFCLILLSLALFHEDLFAEEIINEETVSDASEKQNKKESFDAEDFDELYSEKEEPEQKEGLYDPIEPFNRGVFWFNDKLYFYALKPAARVLRKTPEGFRIAISNFFSNLKTPVRLTSALLQLKIKDSGNELIRFTVNTTIGLGGFFDPAKKWMGIKRKDEDFGQTMGAYGIGPGFYLVLPGIGPSSLRDGIGRLGEAFLDPFIYFFNDYETIGIHAFATTNYTSLDEDTYEGIKRDSIDPYLFVRDAFYQYRLGKIKE